MPRRDATLTPLPLELDAATEVATLDPGLDPIPDLTSSVPRAAAGRKAPPRLRKNAPVIPPKRGNNGRPAAATAGKPKAKKAGPLDEISAALEDPEQAPDETISDAEAVEPGEADEEAVGVPAVVADQDFLGTYFKDLTRLPLLTPAAEYELARRIGIMEEVLWVQALSLAPLVPHLFGVITTHVGQPLPEFAAVEKEAAELWQGGKATGKPLSHAAGPLAAKLRQLDQDRLFIGGLLAELRRIDGALKDGQPNPVSERAVPKETWQIFLQGTSVVNQLIQRAKEDFVKANLRLVVSIARRFNYGRLPLADLIQEGNMGLIKAVERFDYRRGFRFSTYASWWIRHAIARGLADKGRVVRLPVHALAELQSVTRERAKLQRALGRMPTTEELATALKVRPDRLEKMEGALLDDAVSLDREVSGDDKRAFLDLLKDETAVLSISERLISEAMLAEVQKILAALSPIEKDILRLRFGLDSDQELTLSEIGEKYSLSRERIRQIQEQALNRMRRALVRKDLI